VSPVVSGSFQEFHCRGCGGREAFRSRPRGFFEKYLLPLFMLRPARCERCFQRVYVWRTIPLLERNPSAPQPAPEQRPFDSKRPIDSTSSRVA
jgi:hypothetical protein